MAPENSSSSLRFLHTNIPINMNAIAHPTKYKLNKTIAYTHTQKVMEPPPITVQIAYVPQPRIEESGGPDPHPLFTRANCLAGSPYHPQGSLSS